MWFSLSLLFFSPVLLSPPSKGQLSLSELGDKYMLFLELHLNITQGVMFFPWFPSKLNFLPGLPKSWLYFSRFTDWMSFSFCFLRCKRSLGWFAKHLLLKELGLAFNFLWCDTHVTGCISLVLSEGKVSSVKNNLHILQRGVQRYSGVLCSHGWLVGGLSSITVYKPCLLDAQVKLGRALLSCRSYPHEQ